MTLSDLLSEFNIVINTPAGLKELRSLILGLAVRGKLVEQDPNDESASDLLNKIIEKRKTLYKEGKSRKPKKLSLLSDDEIPFTIPNNWTWTRLGNIVEIGSSSRVHKKDWKNDGIPFLRAREIVKLSNNGFVDNELFISKELFKSLTEGGNVPEENDFMITGVGTIGVPYIVKPDDKFYFKDASVLIFKNFFKLYPNYLFYLFKSPLWNTIIHKGSMGTTVHTFTITRSNDVPIPFPPVEEQQRIVQKIESLFAEVDELEEKLTRQTKLDEKLQMAVNVKVQQAPDSKASKSAWNFITSNFETLYKTPEAIDNLKKNILNEAVRGRLVPQNPNDEPASELLQKIEVEKQRLYEEGKIRKPKKLPAISEDEIPYELPESWEWTKISEIFDVGTGSTPNTSESKYYENGTIPWFTSSATNNLFTGKAEKLINEKALDETNCKVFPKGSLIIALYGQGKTRGQVSELTTEGATNQAIAALVSIYDSETESLKKYTKFFFLKIYTEIRELAEGGAQPNLNVGKIKKTIIPVPPLEEQHRIVRRIEELFAICDRFKAQLEQRQKVNEKLVKGLVGEVLEKAGRLEQLTKQELVFWQILIIAYTIKTLQKQQMLQGEMGLAKYIYLIDRIGGIETYFQFKQENFGPYPAIFKKRLYTKSKYFYKRGQKGFEVLDLTSKSNVLFKKESERTTKVERSMEEMAAIFQPYKKDRAAKLELLASVCWLIEKTRKTEFDIIWKELEDWETPKRDDVDNKAELFTKDEVMKCLNFIVENEWEKKLIR